MAETCDARDGDCDGRTDEGDTCGPGAACMYGECIDLREPPAEPMEPIGDDPLPENPRPMLDPGCGCEAGGVPITSVALMLFMLAIVVRRRRQ